MKAIPIAALAVGMAVAFGVAHNLVTVKISPENFTIGHPRILATDSPWKLAVAWGVARPFVAGLLIGVPLAWIATAGPKPKLTARQLVLPIGALCLGMAVGSLAGSVVGRERARSGDHGLPTDLVDKVPLPARSRFITVQTAHAFAHRAGFLGGVILWAYAWRRRDTLAVREERAA